MTPEPVVLEKYLPVWGLPDLSPFCVKVETYLRMAKIPFTTKVGDPRKAPKGKLPVLTDGARTIPDSTAILRHLESTRGAPLDASLTPKERALATALCGMLEEQLYFVIVYQRWKEDQNWKQYRPAFLALGEKLGVPGPLRGFISDRIRKQFLKTLYGQGIGRHAPEEIVDIGKRIVDSVATLYVGPSFFGDKPSTLDATAYAFLSGVLDAPFDGPLRDHLAAQDGLVKYCQHMKARYYA